MAEKVQGSFTFSILDQDNSLYFIRGENPLTIYHYPELGLYLYASTPEILDVALISLKMVETEHKVIQPWPGDILRIDSQGKQETSSFKLIDSYSDALPWFSFEATPQRKRSSRNHITQQAYIRALKAVAVFHGFESEFIDGLIADGYTPDDIEDMIYSHRC